MINYDIRNIKKSLGLDDESKKLKDAIRPLYLGVLDFLKNNNFPTGNLEKNFDQVRVTKAGSGIVEANFSARRGVLAIPNVLDLDGKLAVIHELFHMSSCKELFSNKGIGIRENYNYTSLDEGITDYLTFKYSNFYSIKYPLEEAVAYILTDIFKEDIFEYYFNNDSSGFFNSFGPLSENLKKLINSLDNIRKLIDGLLLSDTLNSLSEAKKIESLFKRASELEKLLYDFLSSYYDFLGNVKSINKIDFDIYNYYDLKDLLSTDQENILFINSILQINNKDINSVIEKFEKERGYYGRH